MVRPRIKRGEGRGQQLAGKEARDELGQRSSNRDLKLASSKEPVTDPFPLPSRLFRSVERRPKTEEGGKGAPPPLLIASPPFLHTESLTR